jgi:hypothetical protein
MPKQETKKTEQKKEDKYLTLKEFKTIMKAISPVQQSEVISKYLKNKIVISNGDVYIINDDMVYEIERDHENEILFQVSKLLLTSFNKLADDDKEEIKEIKDYKKAFKNASIRSYLPQLTTDLKVKNIEFDIYSNVIHFKNGYYDFKSKSFHKRELGKHFVTKCISYDYAPSLKEARNQLFQELAKIYPKENVLNAILTIIASALTGKAIRDSYLLSLLGRASAGKSTILDITKYTTECYVKQIKPDTFIEGKNTDKIVNTYHKCPYIRITWLNEPKDKRFDSTFIKSWADGECNAEKLYLEGSHDFKHYSLTFFTANNMPNIQVDGGVARRIKAYEHTSCFVENDKDTNHKENIFLANKDFKSDFEQSTASKLAFFDILAEFAHKWLENKKIDLPEEFTETTLNIIDSNDHIKDFVDGCLKITGDENDKIGKNEMLKYFSVKYPNKHLHVNQLVTLLKEKKLKYNRQWRINGVQGLRNKTMIMKMIQLYH